MFRFGCAVPHTLNGHQSRFFSPDGSRVSCEDKASVDRRDTTESRTQHGCLLSLSASTTQCEHSRREMNRLFSAIIAVAYLVIAYLASDVESTIKVGLFLLLPLSCIWYSESMGGYTGTGMGRGAITSTSPSGMVAIGGWFLLLLPAIVVFVSWIRGSD